jgi:hypothetical protein
LTPSRKTGDCHLAPSVTFRGCYATKVTVTFLALLALFSAACTPSKALELAHFTENSVDVSIRLAKTETGGTILSATFTPPKGFHLYSKDLPRGGVDGLGRPTLLELPENAKMQPAGPMIESIAAEIPASEPKDLLVYPAGPVTLSLPVSLPKVTEQFEDIISVTFMACTDTGCKPPVVEKLIPIKVPSASTNTNR